MEQEETFGTVLRTLRMKAGYTSQRAFARAAGVPHMTLVSIENGKSKIPTSETLGRIADVLGMSLEDLMARTQPVSSYVPSEDERFKLVKSDVVEIYNEEKNHFENIEFKKSNSTILVKVISDNLESFGIKRNDFLSLRFRDEFYPGELCALENKSVDTDMREFCVRRKVHVESLSKPGKDSDSVMYVIDDLRRFDLMISPDNVNFNCVAAVKEQVRLR
jgi:transcriptional regulator with XRE-family HTH domain